MEFDNHNGEMYRGIPYLEEISGLVYTDSKNNKVFDYSRRIKPEELNKTWIQIAGKAYVRSFDKSKALVYCIAFSVYNEDKTKIIIKRGHLYNTNLLDPIQQYPKKTLFYLELKPTKWSLFPIKTTNIGDKKPRPFRKIYDEVNEMMNEEPATINTDKEKEDTEYYKERAEAGV